MKSQIEQLKHTLTENPSKTIPENQPNIHDINIQHPEHNKVMHTANTLKGKLNSQQKMDTLWLVPKIKEILKTLIQKSENPIYHSGEHMRQQSGIAKYSRYSILTSGQKLRHKKTAN